MKIEFVEEPFCINIVTGDAQGNDGTLTLSINNVEQFVSKKFERKDEVIDKCFSSIDSITVQNPTNDAWTGEIKVTKTGVKQNLSLSCNNGCEGSKFGGKIVVDGNDDAKSQAPSWCLNGNKCFLKVKGKKCYHNFQEKIRN